MKLVQGSYCILKLSDNKPQLARCTYAENGKFKAVLEKEKDKDEKSPPVINFEKEDIMAVLGKRPKVGSVYGLKIEPLVRREHFQFWGDSRIYNWFDDDQFKLLKTALSDAYKTLKKLGVAGYFKVELEVRQPQGKYAGMYKFRPKGDTDILIVKPDLTMDGLEYLLHHEYAHGIWYRMMTPKMRLSWVKLYHKYIKLQQIKEDELKHILEEIESNGSIRGYMREAEDETKAQIKEVLKHIKNIHSFDTSHLEMMLENDESISEYWPSAIEMSEKETCITEYARKSPEEFFAEAIAHKFTNRLLPKRVEELYAKTMARLKKGAITTVDEADDEEEKPTKKIDKKKSKSVRIDHSGMGNDEEKARKKKKDKRKKTLH